VILLEVHPDQQVELTRFDALDSKTWNPPTLAGEYLLVRNHREAACYKLPLAKP
jgi:outer membrane protein assembly factor BamB